MKKLLHITFILFVFYACNSQIEKRSLVNTIVGGPCEGCEAIYEYGEKQLKAIDTLPSFLENEPKLKVIGTVFEKDGKTPAKDVVLYAYHTNREGIYEKKGNEEGWGKRHGHIRGWVKTNANGRYELYTFRPAAYPDGKEPEHIHITIKEPSKNEYYISDIVFDDDPLLTPEKRNKLSNRGGSGLVVLKENQGIYVAQRDIVLGKDIPDY